MAPTRADPQKMNPQGNETTRTHSPLRGDLHDADGRGCASNNGPQSHTQVNTEVESQAKAERKKPELLKYLDPRQRSGCRPTRWWSRWCEGAKPRNDGKTLAVEE